MFADNKERKEKFVTAQLLDAMGLEEELYYFVNENKELVCFDPEGTGKVLEIMFNDHEAPLLPLSHTVNKEF